MKENISEDAFSDFNLLVLIPPTPLEFKGALKRQASSAKEGRGRAVTGPYFPINDITETEMLPKH
jgi:hypothetical protein